MKEVKETEQIVVKHNVSFFVLTLFEEAYESARKAHGVAAAAHKGTKHKKWSSSDAL